MKVILYSICIAGVLCLCWLSMLFLAYCWNEHVKLFWTDAPTLTWFNIFCIGSIMSYVGGCFGWKKNPVEKVKSYIKKRR